MALDPEVSHRDSFYLKTRFAEAKASGWGLVPLLLLIVLVGAAAFAMAPNLLTFTR